MLEEQYASVKLPEELMKILLKTGTGKSIDEKLRLSLAVGFYAEKTVTLERAAELAGKPLADFIEILQNKGIHWMEYTGEQLNEDDLAIEKYFTGAESKNE